MILKSESEHDMIQPISIVIMRSLLDPTNITKDYNIYT